MSGPRVHTELGSISRQAQRDAKKKPTDTKDQNQLSQQQADVFFISQMGHMLQSSFSQIKNDMLSSVIRTDSRRVIDVQQVSMCDDSFGLYACHTTLTAGSTDAAVAKVNTLIADNLLSPEHLGSILDLFYSNARAVEMVNLTSLSDAAKAAFLLRQLQLQAK